MNLLALCPAGIGDALMFTPALQLLRRHYPEARIDVLNMFASSAEVFGGLPEVSNALYNDFLHQTRADALAFVLRLRRTGYDVTFNVYPANRWEYNLVTRLVGAPVRLGHRYGHGDLRNANMLNNRRLPEDPLLHNVEENVRLLAFLDVPPQPIPPMRVVVPEAAHAYAATWLPGAGVPPGALRIGVHPGSSTMKNHIHKRWPPEHFATLGRALAARYGAHLLLFGDATERALKHDLAQRIGAAAHVVDTQGILQTAAIMARCHLIVTNDTALLHLASALRRPVVAMYGPTSEVAAAPWQTPHRILVKADLPCRPCFYYSPRPITCTLAGRDFACVRELTPDIVLEQVVAFLEELAMHEPLPII